MRTVILIAAVSVLLTGCANPVVMKNPETSDLAQCSATSQQWGIIGEKIGIKKCVEQYERAGWQRMS